MIARVEYKNKDLEIVAVEDIDLQLYCNKLSSDLISILSELECILYKYAQANNINVDQAFLGLRHRIFDVSGSIARLPQSIISN